VLFEVDHTTLFTYSEPATLGPHTIRLRPRTDTAQELRSWHLDVDPPPVGRFDYTDQDANAVTRVWWTAPTPSLTIRTAFTVHARRSNPFDFFVFDPRTRQVPARYAEGERVALTGYLTPPPPAARAFAEEVLTSSEDEIAPFLSALAAQVRERVKHENREAGDPLPSDVTLGQGRGACRDAAVVFIDACRAVGIAGRFVSGYQDIPDLERDDDAEDGERHLHAWAEAYIPGAGWRGFDPSQGLAVADRHVAVAAAATARNAAPTEGSFGPAGASARMEARIQIAVRPAP
jgi:transglutaminase-like putative cysteine protease